jgi:hypothetical protein
MKQVSETPAPLRTVRPDAPSALVEILERCLHKRPQDRWPSALQLRDALRRVQRDGSLTAPVPPSDPYRMRVGHRSEDWAPRRVEAPAPAPQDWREAVRQQRHDVQSPRNEQDGDATSARRSDEEVIERFKGQMLSTAGMVVFLSVINATTSPGFPWAIFPAMGMGLGVLGRYIRLRRRGITLGRIFGGESTPKPDTDPRSKPARIADA